MTKQKKCRVGVIYGGKSGEHEVSLHSAASVIKNLDKEKYEPIPIGIDKQGQWLLNTLPDALPDQHSPLLLQTAKSKSMVVPQVAELSAVASAHDIDVFFPVLHGPLYEDGTLQGLLTLAERPFVGCSVLAAAMCMDKVIAKRMMQQAGIPVVPYVSVIEPHWQTQRDSILKKVTNELQYPIFIKPASLGSSVATFKIKDEAELISKADQVFKFDHKMLIEKAINAREIEVSVLEELVWGESPQVSVAGEVRVDNSRHEFYSYTAKYCDPDSAQLLIPAEIDEDQMIYAQYIARNVFNTLQCEGMLRVDLFLDRVSGMMYFNEANPIPGFTSISMYPKLWEASGLPYSKLLTHLIETAMLRFKRDSLIQREWSND